MNEKTEKKMIIQIYLFISYLKLLEFGVIVPKNIQYFQPIILFFGSRFWSGTWLMANQMFVYLNSILSFLVCAELFESHIYAKEIWWEFYYGKEKNGAFKNLFINIKIIWPSIFNSTEQNPLELYRVERNWRYKKNFFN